MRRLTAAMIVIVIAMACDGTSMASSEPDRFCAVYIPPHKITQRNLDEIVHYAALTPVNAVVLHVKTPKGKLLWPSANALALEMGAGVKHSNLKRQVERLKRNKIRTIAKLDLFADHLLAATRPALSVMDGITHMPWTDANGLHWSNPGDRRVWDYNIALCEELAHMGFDEIQFDYVRFPSDGELSRTCYPDTAPGFSKSDCIQSFLELAYRQLKPLGVSISADIFGLTAWKRDDFGVGQVLEKMAPYLDVICPMFYPSHFPKGFLGKQNPGDFPEMIMERSMRSMHRRTQKAVRPWVQGFWYPVEQIIAQIDGIENASGRSWSIWSPTGRYDLSYQAMAHRSGTRLTRPQFYASVAQLRSKTDRSTRGHSRIVNYTNFKRGYSILSLEAPEKGKSSRYFSPRALLGTLDEGIMDQILAKRRIPFGFDTEPYVKRRLLSDLLCGDLGKDARRMRPGPIYIDWDQDCRFIEGKIPPSRMEMYAEASRRPEPMAIASVTATDPMEIASIGKSALGRP